MKIISGGQTGVDMAALEFARQNGLPYGGWVPKGRTNESGRIPDQFTGLTETESEDVVERTRRNVALGDATLIFVTGASSPGTRQTIAFAEQAGKPHLVVDIRDGASACVGQIREWLQANSVSVLNVAGPRASEAPGIGTRARSILELISDQLLAKA